MKLPPMNGAMERVLELLPPTVNCHVRMAYAVGSRETVNPPPTDTDRDTLCRITCDLSVFSDLMEDAGWELSKYFPDEAWTAKTHVRDAHNEAGLDFESYRKGSDNFICTTEERFMSTFLLASQVARQLNLTKKEDRRCLFDAIMYGWAVDGTRDNNVR